MSPSWLHLGSVCQASLPSVSMVNLLRPSAHSPFRASASLMLQPPPQLPISKGNNKRLKTRGWRMTFGKSSESKLCAGRFIKLCETVPVSVDSMHKAVSLSLPLFFFLTLRSWRTWSCWMMKNKGWRKQQVLTSYRLDTMNQQDVSITWHENIWFDEQLEEMVYSDISVGCIHKCVFSCVPFGSSPFRDYTLRWQVHDGRPAAPMFLDSISHKTHTHTHTPQRSEFERKEWAARVFICTE